MMTPAEEAYALDKAYVPEHIVSLMVSISEAEAFLIEDHLSFAKDNWLIVVGYPLDRKFSQDRCEEIVKFNLERFRPEVLWFIGPQVPTSLLESCTERESDQYYQLDLDRMRVKTSLRNAAEKAGRTLSVERAKVFSRENEKLVSELLKREKLPPRIKGLYQAMPRYVAHSASAWVLNAWDQRKRLSAFIVVELAAKHFVTYVLGSDYYGEAKKGFLRMAMWHAKQQGMLGLHAGTKILRARDKDGKLRRLGMIIFGLTATGKTTHACHNHGLSLDGEGVEIVQDDVVFWRRDGSALGTEKGFYIKTEGLDPNVQPLLHDAATPKKPHPWRHSTDGIRGHLLACVSF